jgi:glutamate synthase (ferredoxin)
VGRVEPLLSTFGEISPEGQHAMPSTDGDQPPPRPEFALLAGHAGKDACGLGLIADLQGRRGRRVLDMALLALDRLAHRGAVGADGKTGDGTGVMTEIPWRLLREYFPSLPDPSSRSLALGAFFLPLDRTTAKPAFLVIEGELRRSALELLHWRRVPVRSRVLGALGRAGLPAIYQAIVAAPRLLAGDELERRLYVARRRIEKLARSRGLELTCVSLSGSTTVYKGMVPRTALADFYPDLRHPLFETRAALFHQRFSTNTSPSWRLAQPFRLLAHNGEINTLRGNAYWMRARESELSCPELGADLPEILPLLDESASDSAMLDQAFELLLRAGRSAEHALAMMIPEAPAAQHGEQRRAFFDFHATLMEPWDGPAAVVFFDRDRVGATLDRNGLRPQRFWRSSDGFLILGSETGIAELLPGDRVVERGRLGPGEQLVVELDSGRLWRDLELKSGLALLRPWQRWLADDVAELDALPEPPPAAGAWPAAAELPLLQKAFGFSVELVERILEPMLRDAKPPVGSMGNDAPTAVLSRQPQLPYSYFKQRFAQVTNPPIDPLRERGAFSLDTYAGGWGNLLAERPPARLLRLPSPLLGPADFARLVHGGGPPGLPVATLAALFPAAAGPAGLEPALAALAAAAERAAAAGASLLVLSDRGADATLAPLPMLLAVGAVHQHLLRRGLRMKVSLVCDTGECREDHHIACLLGFGATLVHPWLALATVAARAEALGLPAAPAQEKYLEALEAGLLKVLSRLGVCPLASYHGAQLFEILGLGPEVVERCFAGCRSPLGGVGFRHLASSVLAWHREAFSPADDPGLRDRGFFRFRRGGERHAYSPPVFKALHRAVRGGGQEDWDEFRRQAEAEEPLHLRDLLSFVPAAAPLPLDAVEPAEELCRSFVGAAMSHGALSREAHQTLAIAFNRLGARSNSGEGGEDPRRFAPFGGEKPEGWQAAFVPLPGDSARSKIKQVASGRFGVTAAYLADAEELEIKIAQGSKPGEGGQIPGNKVTAEIAALRRAVPGRPLISPPPHHDIYSIEDLAQLIYDLSRINPRARIGVKLVALGGVGTVAVGVAKAGADYIHVAGDDGGTGASPLSSIKHVGLPWELGLAETHQALSRAGLRGRVRLRVDGGLKTGRDVVAAALLGADELGFGTAPLIALGCVMARQCHLDTCPVGIATQQPELRRRFPGQPEQAIAFLLFVAEEARRLLAELGLASLAAAVGRTDLLAPREELCRERGLDLSPLLAAAGRLPAAPPPVERPGVEDELLRQMASSGVRRATFTAVLGNRDRTFGARLSAALLAGEIGPGPFVLEATGVAGQGFGAFLAAGLELRLSGEAQDHVAKGLSGGRVILRPAEKEGAAAVLAGTVLAGNALLYGATGGELYVAGKVGERFAVRNSGALAVVEGCGDHGCEYMTAGAVLVLGPVGQNFGAGMTGGKAWVLAAEGDLEARCSPEVAALPLRGEDLDEVGALLRGHAGRTGSAAAWSLLAAWPQKAGKLRRIVPRCENEEARNNIGEIPSATPL